MQFRDLRKQYSVLKQDIDAAMMEVAASSAFIMGRPVKELEAGLAEYVGVKHCISCGNGTDALLLSLLAVGLQRGDEVIVPAFAFAAVAETVLLLGGVLVFADVDPRTFNIDPASVARRSVPDGATGPTRRGRRRCGALRRGARP